MEELTIEEKAKRYDEALKEAVVAHKDEDRHLKATLERIFSELAESEDERMVKFIKNQLFNIKKTITDNYKLDTELTKAIDWLEKQGEHKIQRCGVSGFTDIVQAIRTVYNEESAYDLVEYITDLVSKKEQKPAFEMKTPEESLGINSETYSKIVDECIYGEQKPIDNQFTPEQASVLDKYIDKFLEQHPANILEPKFKVGDWIVNNINKDIFLIKSINNGYCTLEDIKGNIISPCLPPCENESHLWTIQDAKEGDVLSWNDSKCIAIFKNIYDEDSFNSYGFVGDCTGTFESRQSYHDIEGAHPATKEQRDTLEKAMADAGYTFDFEKKELKKIETKTAAWTPMDEQRVENLLAIIEGHGYPGEVAWLNSLKDRVQSKQGEQKPVEWSEEDSNMLQSILDEYKSMAIEKRNFLKSLKDRVQPQPKQEWTEEDEMMIKFALTHFRTAGATEDSDIIKWLKSLKERYTWKPSDEQMKALKEAVDEHFDIDGGALWNLYQNLKKLKK